MTATPIDIGLADVALSLVLVAITVGVSIWWRVDLERQIGIAVARSFVQLTAIGFVIAVIFESGEVVFALALIAVMVVFGALTARSRARRVPGVFLPLVIALTVAGGATLGLVVALGIFEPEPRYLVPVGGMVIGNAMTAAAVALNRLGDDIHENKGRIEAELALGATSRQAALPILRRSLRSGTITLIDSTKTTGLIFFPGTMVGMLLAGAEVTDAVRLQLILLYTILGAVALSALIATTLAYRGFFTGAHQLRDVDASPGAPTPGS